MPYTGEFTQRLLIICIFTSQVSSSILPSLKLVKNHKDITQTSEVTLPTEIGYKIAKHEVVTQDGYVLQIFRLVNEEKCERKGILKRPPVLLIHGLLESSDIFLDLGEGRSLAYLLASACFEVWLGNVRGNFHGRSHVTLNPDRDADFWRFSVDEMGVYDIPAIIDYVINHTKAPKVNYLGFSQGCGTFYIMCSERPGYCSKINLKISLAPATRHLNTKSVMFRNVCETIERYRKDLERSGIYEVFAKGGVTQELLLNLCKERRYQEYCLGLVKAFDAGHPRSIKRNTLKLLFEHFPAGTSVQNVARYGQSLQSRSFVKFNFGPENNLQIYGQVKPPKYNLSAVTVPVVVMYGRNDGIVDISDVKWLIRKLPNVVEELEINHPMWTHVDNVYSRFVPKLLAPKIIETLEKYSFV